MAMALSKKYWHILRAGLSPEFSGFSVQRHARCVSFVGPYSISTNTELCRQEWVKGSSTTRMSTTKVSVASGGVSDLAIATFVPVVALVHKSSDKDDSSVDGHIDEDSAGVDGNGDDGGDNENSSVASGKPALFNWLLVYF